jgi:glycosyltransferase involved in cell wall biosynthesis
MSWTVLSVAYPLAPVGPDAVGGAEQVLSHLDRSLVEAGHRSIVVACQGSKTAGELFETRVPPGMLSDDVKREVQRRHWRNILEALDRWDIDLVHMHGIDFDEYLPPNGVKVLATLHLPPSWYPRQVFNLPRPETYLHCVSSSQRRSCPAGAKLLDEIENGVPIHDLLGNFKRRDFAVALGRICPEKNFHAALEAGRLAHCPVMLAGRVFGYEAHVNYFEREIRPRLDEHRRFVGPVGLGGKRRLLNSARCLLVPSLAPETSSLVAMEALACGTPVVAYPSGALPEIVEHGLTGFIVKDEREMADAIGRVGEIDRQVCMETARRRFSLEKMVDRYFETYAGMIGSAQIKRRGYAMRV